MLAKAHILFGQWASGLQETFRCRKKWLRSIINQNINKLTRYLIHCAIATTYICTDNFIAQKLVVRYITAISR